MDRADIFPFFRDGIDPGTVELVLDRNVVVEIDHKRLKQMLRVGFNNYLRGENYGANATNLGRNTTSEAQTEGRDVPRCVCKKGRLSEG